ncbi:hypothetical protein BDZ90DRAFT_175990 [Jaminaea rosea]|uniref:Uncharacterized protein n=1 Tax=Jaminaea rosea TaxID=1569628 RepID=A0A316UPV9_9BASI|nr:hypothetical protein BDZ90DRAFT_175990 [Jaminaea rosea]PWN27342.1 hypothetical protein BDZ90DRAFT_175990 [Jaminaea rosea]
MTDGLSQTSITDSYRAQYHHKVVRFSTCVTVTRSVSQRIRQLLCDRLPGPDAGLGRWSISVDLRRTRIDGLVDGLCVCFDKQQEAEEVRREQDVGRQCLQPRAVSVAMSRLVVIGEEEDVGDKRDSQDGRHEALDGNPRSQNQSTRPVTNDDDTEQARMDVNGYRLERQR